MSNYDEIMEPIMAGDVSALEKLSCLIDGFPTGKDDFIHRHWITNCIDCGTVDVVAWMLRKGAPVIFQADDGYTVLHAAIEREKTDKYEIIQLLIDNGADINAHGIHDWTPAHMAAARNDVETLKLLKSAGADFTICTRIDNYATPLEEAKTLAHSHEAVVYLTENIKPGGPGG